MKWKFRHINISVIATTLLVAFNCYFHYFELPYFTVVESQVKRWLFGVVVRQLASCVGSFGSPQEVASVSFAWMKQVELRLRKEEEEEGNNKKLVKKVYCFQLWSFNKLISSSFELAGGRVKVYVTQLYQRLCNILGYTLAQAIYGTILPLTGCFCFCFICLFNLCLALRVVKSRAEFQILKQIWYGISLFSFALNC